MTRTETKRTGGRTTPAECAIVQGGFVLAALWTACAVASGTGMETVAAAWLAAGAWAFVASLVLALRRGLRHRDWRAFRRYAPTDGTELIDWSTNSGKWYDLAVAEENERLMRGD
ncbi:MAG: hypothetical protein F4204_06085 [Rhodospirillaceae bacterium]|nr:hypothetical protein [Rhodospirillaceae bacterium]MYG51919.1 hypothetical protein [Rhodospirillaceae bacterium]MYH38795.1 hypothetical protein [Rhodospirillaceae bacterium]